MFVYLQISVFSALLRSSVPLLSCTHCFMYQFVVLRWSVKTQITSSPFKPIVSCSQIHVLRYGGHSPTTQLFTYSMFLQQNNQFCYSIRATYSYSYKQYLILDLYVFFLLSPRLNAICFKILLKDITCHFLVFITK